MNGVVWFLSEAAFPVVGLGGGFALALAVATSPPRRRVRHYRWRNRRWLRRQVREIELRSRAVRGGSGEEDRGVCPRPPQVLAGVEHPPAPPAPCPLVGAGVPQRPAPARPPIVRLGGAL